MFHRQDMHKMFMDCALQEEGEGTPVKLIVNHKVIYLLSINEPTTNSLHSVKTLTLHKESLLSPTVQPPNMTP
jgi:hypothetical protein